MKRRPGRAGRGSLVLFPMETRRPCRRAPLTSCRMATGQQDGDEHLLRWVEVGRIPGQDRTTALCGHGICRNFGFCFPRHVTP